MEKGCWKIMAAHVWNAFPNELRVVGSQTMNKFLNAVVSDRLFGTL